MTLGSSIISVIPTLLVLGAIAIIFRNFTVDGKKMKFELNSTHRTKTAAEREAKSLRDDDFLVKVTMKKKAGGKKEFNVWKHNGDTDSNFANRKRKGKAAKKDDVFDL